MQAYRCGNCRRTLIGGAIFCTHCDSFFEEPIPYGDPVGGCDCFVAPASTPIIRSRKMTKNLLGGLALSVIACVALLTTGSVQSKVLSASRISGPTLMEALDADLVADADENYENRRYATDLMLSMSTNCRIQHAAFSRKPGDHVLMFTAEPLTLHQEKNRLVFAATLLRDLRQDYFTDPDEQAVSILMLDSRGNRLAAQISGTAHGKECVEITDIRA